MLVTSPKFSFYALAISMIYDFTFTNSWKKKISTMFTAQEYVYLAQKSGIQNHNQLAGENSIMFSKS